MPSPAANNIEIHDNVENSGSLSSAPNRMRPDGAYPTTSMNTVTPSTTAVNIHPRFCTTQACIEVPTSLMLSGAMNAHATTARLTSSATAKTTVLVGNFLSVSSTEMPGTSAG